jgi:hypothetical protein
LDSWLSLMSTLGEVWKREICWTPKCEESFQELKIILTSVLILKVADLDEDSMVCIYACKEGLGGILSQKDHVVCFESRKIKEHEKNYSTHDLQLATIVHALKMWRHYLMGKRFELRMDHCGLKHLFGQPTINVRQTRWLEFLNEYDIEIKHIRGKENQVVDALSRRSHEVHVLAIYTYKTYLKDKTLEVESSDQLYLQIKRKLTARKFTTEI